MTIEPGDWVRFKYFDTELVGAVSRINLPLIEVMTSALYLNSTAPMHWAIEEDAILEVRKPQKEPTR